MENNMKQQYVALKEFKLGNVQYNEGDDVLNAAPRLIALGLIGFKPAAQEVPVKSVVQESTELLIETSSDVSIEVQTEEVPEVPKKRTRTRKK